MSTTVEHHTFWKRNSDGVIVIVDGLRTYPGTSMREVSWRRIDNNRRGSIFEADFAHRYTLTTDPRLAPTAEQIDAVAAAIAKAADADYWVDEIAEWDGAEEWEREAYPDHYPSTAVEEREHFRKQARAALEAAARVGGAA
jgi:hypothetical protein